jgi:hypothetical protein
MATTPNFNWSTPDNTGLVKNGALDIRTLGNAIDASMVDLKGGTTGQVLAKQTNTDMDFQWIAPSAGSSNVAGKNGVLNSAFNVWQRGTSSAIGTTSSFYLADRWQSFRGATGSTISRQVTNDTTNLPFIQYCARIQRDSGNTSTSTIFLSQNFETVNAIPFAGRNVVLSFYARAGANFSGSSSLLAAQLITGTGTDQNWIAGYTGQAVPINQNVTLTTTWQRFSVTGTIAATATELAVSFNYSPTGTAGANDFYEITGVQLEIASSASAYSPNCPTQQAEIAACQRYFQMIAEGNNAYIFNGNNWYAFDVRGVYTFPVQMRTAPTLVGTTGTNFYRVQYSTTTDDLNEIKMSNATVRNCLLLNDTQAAVTAGTPGTVLTNNASASVAISAEL